MINLRKNASLQSLQVFVGQKVNKLRAQTTKAREIWNEEGPSAYDQYSHTADKFYEWKEVGDALERLVADKKKA